MKRFIGFVFAAMLAASVGMMSREAMAGKGSEDAVLDPTLEQDLVAIERLRALLAESTREVEELRAERSKLITERAQIEEQLARARASQSNSGDREEEQLRALLAELAKKNTELTATNEKKVAELRSLLHEAAGKANSIPRLERDNAGLRQKIEQLRALLAVAGKATNVDAVMASRAIGYVQRANQLASQAVDTARAGLGDVNAAPKLMCVIPYDVGAYAVTNRGRVCVEQVKHVMNEFGPRVVGLVGLSDEIKCRSYGTQHEPCNEVLATMRASHLNRILKSEGIMDVRLMPGVGTMKKGFRMVEVWDLGPTTGAVLGSFASKFHELEGRVKALEDSQRELEDRVNVHDRRLLDQDRRIRSLEGRPIPTLESPFHIRWNRFTVAGGASLVGDDPYGDVELGMRFALLNDVFGIGITGAYGIGAIPPVAEDPNKGFGHLWRLGFEAWFQTGDSVSLAVKGLFVAASAGQFLSYDELGSGVQVCADWLSGTPGDQVRVGVDACAGWTRGFSGEGLDDWRDVFAGAAHLKASF